MCVDDSGKNVEVLLLFSNLLVLKMNDEVQICLLSEPLIGPLMMMVRLEEKLN